MSQPETERPAEALARELEEARRQIAEQLRAKDELRRSEERFRAIFDHLTEGVLVAIPQTRKFALANRTACAMLSYSEAELLNLGVHDIHPPSALPLVANAYGRRARGVVDAVSDLPVKRKDGTIFFADVHSVLVTLDGRELVVGSFRDVTERKRRQACLAQEDRLASLGLMAAGVSHELNNPLAYVLSNVDTLTRDLPKLFGAVRRCCAALRSQLPAPAFDRVVGEGADLLNPVNLDDLVDCARDALEGTLRIRSLSRILGTFSRVDQLDLSEVSLKNTLEAAATLAHDEIKCRATLVKEFGEVPAVWASEGKLSQVFLNLLVNAAHAIEAGAPARNRITVRAWAEKDQVFAEVADTGRGIAPENLERIFEPFFTTKTSGFGSGLGLTMCKTLVGEFGGDLRVESELGKGSRFVVRLPAVPKAPRAP